MTVIMNKWLLHLSPYVHLLGDLKLHHRHVESAAHLITSLFQVLIYLSGTKAEIIN